jgi:hypothetical protein
MGRDPNQARRNSRPADNMHRHHPYRVFDAQRWLSNIETTIHREEWVDPAGGQMTVAGLADRWKTRDPSKRSSTKARDETILRIHILPTFGGAG